MALGWSSQVMLSYKEPTYQCKRHRRYGFNFWAGKVPWGSKWHTCQYSCLENPMNREAW